MSPWKTSSTGKSFNGIFSSFIFVLWDRRRQRRLISDWFHILVRFVSKYIFKRFFKIYIPSIDKTVICNVKTTYFEFEFTKPLLNILFQGLCENSKLISDIHYLFKFDLKTFFLADRKVHFFVFKMMKCIISLLKLWISFSTKCCLSKFKVLQFNSSFCHWSCVDVHYYIVMTADHMCVQQTTGDTVGSHVDMTKITKPKKIVIFNKFSQF